MCFIQSEWPEIKCNRFITIWCYLLKGKSFTNSKITFDRKIEILVYRLLSGCIMFRSIKRDEFSKNVRSLYT